MAIDVAGDSIGGLEAAAETPVFCCLYGVGRARKVVEAVWKEVGGGVWAT